MAPPPPGTLAGMNANRTLAAQFRARVIAPVLGYLGAPLDSPAAHALLLGTAVQESGLARLAQDPTGPALGYYQIEPATHDDVFFNFLIHRADLLHRVMTLAAPLPDRRLQLVTNAAYATAIARIIYFRAPDPLPAPDDIAGLAAYWKRHYNTAGGAGQVSDFIANYQRFIGG